MLKNQSAFAFQVSVLLLSGSLLTTSCSPADKQGASNENQQAHNDFQTFVAATQAKVDAVGDELEADYDRETAELKASYDAKAAAVDKYAEQYDDARRREMQALRARYQTAYDKPETAGSSPDTVSANARPGTAEGSSEPINDHSRVRRVADNTVHDVKKVGKGVGRAGAKAAKSVGHAVKSVFKKDSKK